jgi:hypothetical protein
MSDKRLQRILSNQTKVAFKVWNAVSLTEPQTSKRIYQALITSGNPVRDLHTVEGCLSSLVKSKLLTENPRGMFVKSFSKEVNDAVTKDHLEYLASPKGNAHPSKQTVRKWSEPKVPFVKETVVETVQPPAVVEPVVVESEAIPVADPIVYEKPVATDVPLGRFSQYLLPKHSIIVNYPNSGGVQNYAILRAANPGDIIRFARPEGLGLTKWRNRVTTNRHYYYTKFGILTEAHFYQEYVDLQVMRQDDPEAPKNVFNVSKREVTAEEELAFPGRTMGRTVTHLIDDQSAAPMTEDPTSSTEVLAVVTPDGAEEPAVDVPTVLESPVDEPVVEVVEPEVVDTASTDVTVLTSTSSTERDLWTTVYLLKVGHVATVVEAVSYADASVGAYRERFNNVG